MLEGFTMIAENFKKVLNNYLQTYDTEPWGGDLAKFIFYDLTEPFKKLVDENKYIVNGASGQGRWTLIPSLSILNKEITSSPQDGYYIVYLFKEDMSGVCLSLNFGSTDFSKKFGKKNLPRAAKNFRNLLQEEFEETQQYTPLYLGRKEGAKNHTKAITYESGDIYSIEYSLDDLDSDEKLINDFKFFLKLYDYLYEKRGTTILTEEELNEEVPVEEPIEEGEEAPPQITYQGNFIDYLTDKNYFFDEKIIENYLLSLKVKPFAILTGNSGTGKTKLSQLFAEYLYKKQKTPTINHAIVPVGANWTENRNIVGYFNVLTKTYQHTQSLDLLLYAEKDKQHPYFLILDEMNLSHVERYFSDFLSSIESHNPIPLHKDDDKLEDDFVPEELEIPNNVFIIGTVNVDETTYMFSPKVLDRSNVLEFKTFESISIIDYINNKNIDIDAFSGDLNYLENPLSDVTLKENILSEVNGEFSNVTFNSYDEVGNEIEINLLNYIADELSVFHEYLSGSGFEFGFRTVNEVLAFMVVAWKYEGEKEVWDNWRRYFDAQILQKILPKLHGSKMILGETLDNLISYCLGIDSVDEIKDFSADLTEFNLLYPDSAKKLIQMKDILEKQSYVSFIN